MLHSFHHDARCELAVLIPASEHGQDFEYGLRVRMMRVAQLLGDAVIADRPAERERHVAGATPPTAPRDPVLKLAEQLAERRRVAQSAHAGEAAKRDEEAAPTGTAQPSRRTSHGTERGAK